MDQQNNNFEEEKITLNDAEKFENELFTQFEEEATLLNQSLNEIDELYGELKEHYEGVKNSRTSGSLMFLGNQAKNLVELKKQKLAIIQQKMQVKSKLTDIYFKNKTISSGEGSDAKEILSCLNSLIKNEANNTSISTSNDDEFDKLLEDRANELIDSGLIDKDYVNQNYKENNISDIEQPSILDFDDTEDEDDESKITFVFDTDKNIYALDKDDEILENYICPKIDVEIDNDNAIAIDKETGEIYQLVEFED